MYSNCRHASTLFPIVLIVPASDYLRGSGWIDRAKKWRERERERETWQSCQCVSSLVTREPPFVSVYLAGHKLACFVPQAGATRHTQRHVNNLSVSAFYGEPARCSGARFINPPHGQVVFVGEHYNTLRSYYSISVIDRWEQLVQQCWCVGECASIHDMSVVNLPHIRDAHQWQGHSGGTRTPIDCCSCVRGRGSV